MDVDTSPPDISRPDTSETAAPSGAPASPRVRQRGGSRLVRVLARGIGQSLITVGVVALLLVVYQLWVVDLFTAQHQDRLVTQIHQQWQDQPTVTPAPGSTPSSTPIPSGGAPPAVPASAPAVGRPFALLHIPRMHGNWAVVEGVALAQLAEGPGHYIGTAMPGQQGDFAVAGHAIRSVFLHLDTLRPGDPIIVETASYWFVYRVLGDVATGTFTGDPSGIPGQETVLPTATQVIAPSPDSSPNGPATGAYLTLTTCTPALTATHRLIVHARLDELPISKISDPTGPPALNGA